MTTDEKLDELLKVYNRISLLSDKNGCKVIKICHKELEKNLVVHILPKENSVYQTLCQIRHKNLPAIYDVFNLTDGTIVLEEYIEGLTVAEICDSGKYKKRGAIKIARELCFALSVLHENNIVHRDIKPENIMVDNFGRVVLIDFDASRRISLSSQDTTIIGTVGYASPEQLGITQSDARTDIYAVGILLNTLITGNHPSVKMAKGRIGKVIKKCTAINPDNRYQTAIKLARALFFA